MAKPQQSERIVALHEVRHGKVRRRFFCIQEREFGLWMSTDPFGGAIWTKDPGCRREFPSRQAASACLDEFNRWRSRPPVEPRQDKAGEPIPGSRYVRAFCKSCGDPMRVTPESYRNDDWPSCTYCQAALHPGGNEGAQTLCDEDAGGYASIGRRAMEDAA